jgi:murein DD-endopeptidase MepM/ murein hydrolase activator NlpD
MSRPNRYGVNEYLDELYPDFDTPLPPSPEYPRQDWADEINQQIEEANRRALEPLLEFQEQLDAIAAQTNAIYQAERSKIERRSVLIGLGIIFGCVAWIQVGHPLLKVGKATVEVVKEKASAVGEAIAPDLSKTPKRGDKIPGTPYRVTSPWGHRNTGIPGASTFHQGVDADTPIGTPVYAIGKPGQSVTVRCWTDSRGGGLVASYETFRGIAFDYLHLSQCSRGSHKAGSIIARTGDSGIGAAHFHLSQRNAQGQKVEPQKGYLIWALTGREPLPLFSKPTKALASPPSRSAVSPKPRLITPAPGAFVSQGFDRQIHEGIDFSGDFGMPIVATADGIVTKAGWDKDGLGKAITIQHSDGSRTVYGHNQRLLIKAGDRVKAGEIIAEMGSTGFSTGPHLHLEIWVDGKPVDPTQFLPTLPKRQK